MSSSSAAGSEVELPSAVLEVNIEETLKRFIPESGQCLVSRLQLYRHCMVETSIFYDLSPVINMTNSTKTPVPFVVSIAGTQ